MIKINKVVEIIIDGKEIETLVNICEIARIALQERGHKGFCHIEGSGKGEAIESMMETIFDA